MAGHVALLSDAGRGVGFVVHVIFPPRFLKIGFAV
jgi:hypothetical protein